MTYPQPPFPAVPRRAPPLPCSYEFIGGWHGSIWGLFSSLSQVIRMVRVVIQVHPCSSKFILSNWRLIWIKKMEWLVDPPRNLFFAFLSFLFSPLRFLSFCLLSFCPFCSYLWSSFFILVQFRSTKFVCLFVFLSFCLSVFLFSTKSCFKAKNTHFGKFRTPRPPSPFLFV